MNTLSLLTRLEELDDVPAIDGMYRAAFGPGAYARAAFRVREQAPHEPSLSFVTSVDGRLVASVRLTPIEVGDRVGLLLGPLVVEPDFKNLGYGKALLRKSVETARQQRWRFVLLVGDEPYYGPFGFCRVRPGTVRMPGPVDPGRLLVNELVEGEAAQLNGDVRGIRPVARRLSA